jgi:hypothetical protein
MSDKPEAIQGLGGESDVIAERSGATTERGRRPIPVDPPEATAEADAEETGDEENEEGEVPHPDAGPTA